MLLTLAAGVIALSILSQADQDGNVAQAGSLEALLLEEGPEKLAQDARKLGDPARGGILFFQPTLGCAKCHTADKDDQLVAPDLARPKEKVTDAYLVESILAPSKTIKKDYEPTTVLLADGQVVSGLVVSENDAELVLRDPSRDLAKVAIKKSQIERRAASQVSAMPAGLANQVGTRQQFLDLVRYVLEVSEKGPARARELRPEPFLFAAPPIPSYEQDIDHAGMLASLDQKSFERGQKIYERVCANCHGTKEKAGSLPTSLRFASGQFKNGNDPYSMYQTLTRGFGLMLPQSWMVPQQKYDVIHYIRETYLAKDNPTQHFKTTPAYLARLPKGTSRGPEPLLLEPWVTMDYGPSLAGTFEIGSDRSNIAYKGIAIRLDAGTGGVSRGRYWALYDHDTMRLAGAWTGQGFIDWNCIHFTGQHDVHPQAVGKVLVKSKDAPGWEIPEAGLVSDQRIIGRDGRRYGPLPKNWIRYKGIYHFGNKTILSYSVGETDILEMPGIELKPGQIAVTRKYAFGPRKRELLNRDDGFEVWRDDEPTWQISQTIKADSNTTPTLSQWREASYESYDLSKYTHGGPPRWPTKLETQIVRGKDDGPFAVDVLTHPANNPWLCRMRFTGFDFFPGKDLAAICSWDGDVWLVEGLESSDGKLRWQRIASGLFQPLGLKIVDGKIYVCCRDQICILHDLNGDNETDFYECFNSDHQVTDHFHEFATGLQTDAEGNFYYAKAARHAKDAVVPQHGTLLRVSKDGSKTDILARGFRAPNGVCLNPDGTFFLTDQEGHWIPKNRINWIRPGRFYGNMMAYVENQSPADSAMDQPVCWITNVFDRSPSEPLWVTSKKWAPLEGSLLNFSYGYGKVYLILRQMVGDMMQGGMVALPIKPFPTGVMRGRFHPVSGQLYCCGMYAWASNQEQPGGFYRIRRTEKPLYVPLALTGSKRGLDLGFAEPLDAASASDPKNYSIKVWSLKRSAKYGSEHHGEHALEVSAAKLTDDGKTIQLTVPALAPTMCMEIKYSLKSRVGERIEGSINNTIHALEE